MSAENHLNGEPGLEPTAESAESAEEEYYDPGDTVSRPMGIACMLMLLFFALISCGFIFSALSSHH